MLGEVVVQLVFEGITELIGHSVKPFRLIKLVPPILAAAGYFIVGAIAGAISLLIFPSLFISSTWMRTLNLVLTPLAAGLAMSGIGALRRKKEQDLIRLDTFSYAFCFAFSMALVRYLFGQ
jgi:hypothetical protein